MVEIIIQLGVDQHLWSLSFMIAMVNMQIPQLDLCNFACKYRGK